MLIAVLTHYWTSRREHLPVIVDALWSGSVKPDRLVIWNNSHEPLKSDTRQLVINASQNFGPFARFAAALVAANAFGKSGDVHILMHDDDLAVGKDTVKKLLGACEGCSALVGMAGRLLNRDSERPYREGFNVVDGFAHVVMALTLCRAEVIAEALAFAAVNGITVFREDDILLSLSNLMHGGSNQVVPVEWSRLGDQQESLCRQPEHWAERDEFCLRFLREGWI